MDRLRQEIRVRHYSMRTEQAYTDWVRRFIVFHGKRYPSELGAAEVASFLTHLAVKAIKLAQVIDMPGEAVEISSPSNFMDMICRDTVCVLQ